MAADECLGSADGREGPKRAESEDVSTPDTPPSTEQGAAGTTTAPNNSHLHDSGPSWNPRPGEEATRSDRLPNSTTTSSTTSGTTTTIASGNITTTTTTSDTTTTAMETKKKEEDSEFTKASTGLILPGHGGGENYLGDDGGINNRLRRRDGGDKEDVNTIDTTTTGTTTSIPSGGGGDKEDVNIDTTTTTTTCIPSGGSGGGVGASFKHSSRINTTTAATTTTTTTPSSPPSSSSPLLSSSSPTLSRRKTTTTSTTTPTTTSTTKTPTTATATRNNSTKKTYYNNNSSNNNNISSSSGGSGRRLGGSSCSNSSNNDNNSNNYHHNNYGNNNSSSSYNNTSVGSIPSSMNAREYAQVVRLWLWQYQQWNSMCTFSMMLPYYAMATFPYYAATNNYPGFPPRTNSSSSPSSSSPTNSPINPGATNDPAAAAAGGGGGNLNPNFQGAGGVRGRNVAGQHAAGGAGHGGAPRQNPQPAARPAEQHLRATEYIIPSLWKRILAELVDFVLLFYIKLIVSVMVMRQMGYIDLEKYDLEYNWYVAMDDFDISKMFHFTSEMILFELLNRISITIVETMCLQRGIGVVGGSTPGKRLLGMKVVSCTEISDLGNGRIRVTPAQDIGLNSALLRSVLKNFTIAFFFPACLTVFFFDHNRAAYDVLAGSIVVQPIEEAGQA
ncbi:uncharacterized protein DDB_G0271670-like [Argonauta hians]